MRIAIIQRNVIGCITFLIIIIYITSLVIGRHDLHNKSTYLNICNIKRPLSYVPMIAYVSDEALEKFASSNLQSVENGRWSPHDCRSRLKIAILDYLFLL